MMYLRTVTHTVQNDKVIHLVETYERMILPALRSTSGCIFASLLQNTGNVQECISLTIWKSQQESLDYEESGLFRQLVNSLRPFFIESNEWNLELTEDLSLEYTPIQTEPTVTRFANSVTGSEEITRLKEKPFAAHILSLTVQDDQHQTFEDIFSHDIHPKFKTHKGFIDLILLRLFNEYHIMSFWDETVDIQSPFGIHSMNHLLKSIYSILPSFIQWKVSHRAAARISASTEDIKAVIYRCLTSEWFTR
jgi:heme-degrading monooxygenase HmoA